MIGPARATRTTRRIATAVSLAAMLAVAALVPAAAQAVPSTNIDAGTANLYGNGPFAGCSNEYCLWRGAGVSGANWGSNTQYQDPIGGYFIGTSQQVSASAASMADRTSNCHVTTWVNSNLTGPANYLDSDYWGNLTNNGTFPLLYDERSIDWDSC